MMFNKPGLACTIPTMLEVPRTEDGRMIIGEDNGDLITLPSFANGNQPFKGMMTFLSNHFGGKLENGI